MPLFFCGYQNGKLITERRARDCSREAVRTHEVWLNGKNAEAFL